VLAAASPHHVPPVSAPSRRSLETIAADDPRRGEVEHFIASVYRRHYDARPAHWAPTLVALRIDGRLAAAAGYRRAHGALFLEHYLDVPVEAAITVRTGRRVARHDVCEVGHFASERAGEGRRLMLMLAHHLHGLGVRWVASTATRELRELLLLLGMTPHALAVADPARVPGGGTTWGRYYDHAPVVIAGDLRRGLAVLERRRKA
jgi:hypothetical protein